MCVCVCVCVGMLVIGWGVGVLVHVCVCVCVYVIFLLVVEEGADGGWVFFCEDFCFALLVLVDDGVVHAIDLHV